MKSAAASADRYLWFRPQSRFIWFRMAVPKEARGLAGKNVIQCSLGTGDRREALILAGKKRAELFEEWGLVSAPSVPPVSRGYLDPLAIAVKTGFDGMLAALEANRKTWPANDEEYSALLAQRDADLRRLTRRLQDGDLTHWEGVADRKISAERLALPKDSEAYSAFVRALAEGSIDALGKFNREASGDLDAAPRSEIVRQVKAKEAATAKAGETLLELFELWAAEMLAKGEKRADTINQDRKAIKQFAAFVGADRDVRSITPLEVAEYRDTMRQLPPKWMSKRELRDLDMRAAAALARASNMPQMAFTNCNKHLSTISPLYKWLAAQPKWAGLRNPVDGLYYDGVKGKNPRPPFKTAALNKMLGSPLFTGFLADGREHVPGNMQADDWRCWIPLVCLFTGARLGEIAQLRTGDVRKERGVWFIHIRHEEKEGLTTKSGKSRFAAVHPILEKIGFLAFHERQLERAGGDLEAPLFPELAPNARGQISGTPSRWWRDYLTAIGVKDDSVEGGDGIGSHSFRHTLADRLRSEAEILDDQVEVCLGHNQKTVTSGYGELPQGTVTMFQAWMNAVRFDGVDFSHLIAGEEARKAA